LTNSLLKPSLHLKIMTRRKYKSVISKVTTRTQALILLLRVSVSRPFILKYSPLFRDQKRNTNA
jgi:hypothetical protein